ncbi:hypothetical protein B5G03_04515 [Gemmiger sp. An50]|nr:hypothetical protein B5G03_04515 [Gemmiger sp. An50]
MIDFMVRLLILSLEFLHRLSMLIPSPRGSLVLSAGFIISVTKKFFNIFIFKIVTKSFFQLFATKP